MTRKNKVSYEQKIEAVEDYLSGRKSATNICFELNLLLNHLINGFVNLNYMVIMGLRML